MTGRKHRPPTLNELHTLLENLPSRIQLAIYLAAYGGLRLSEWRALRRRDLTIVEGRVLVNVERTAQYLDGHGWHVGPPKTAEGVRLVPLPLSLTEHVQRHLSTHVGPFPDALLFPRRVDPAEFMRDGEFNAMWNKARDAAGVRDVVREHDLRAFAGTTFAQSGATLRETMRLLGHSTTVAAMAYQHTADERMQELTDLMPLPGSTRTNLTHLNA
nr:tyrosine-type recombinase/integrase [Microbacterium halimionae]